MLSGAAAAKRSAAAISVFSSAVFICIGMKWPQVLQLPVSLGSARKLLANRLPGDKVVVSISYLFFLIPFPIPRFSVLSAA